MRVVADTNTLVSGFGWGGAPGLWWWMPSWPGALR